jgi:hypothetical protein
MISVVGHMYYASRFPKLWLFGNRYHLAALEDSGRATSGQPCGSVSHQLIQFIDPDTQYREAVPPYGLGIPMLGDGIKNLEDLRYYHSGTEAKRYPAASSSSCY